MNEAIKAGDRVQGDGGQRGTVIATHDEHAWVKWDGRNLAYSVTSLRLIPPAPHPVAWINLDADGYFDSWSTRSRADEAAGIDRAHVITIYSDGTTTTTTTTTTEAVS